MSDQIPALDSFDDAALDRAFATLTAEVQTGSGDAKAFRLHWLGRKQGRLKLISDAWLKSAPAEARKPLGMRFNQLKQVIEAALEAPGEAAAKPLHRGLDITLAVAAPRGAAGCCAGAVCCANGRRGRSGLGVVLCAPELQAENYAEHHDHHQEQRLVVLPAAAARTCCGVGISKFCQGSLACAFEPAANRARAFVFMINGAGLAGHLMGGHPLALYAKGWGRSCSRGPPFR